MKRIALAFVAALLPTQALAQTQFPASTLWGNATASTGLPTTVTLPNCPSGALNFTAGTGFGCGTGGGGGTLAHTHLLVGNGSNVATDFGGLATFADSGGLTIIPTSGSTAAGLTISQTGPNSGSQAGQQLYNSIIVNDGINITAGGTFSNALFVMLDQLSNAAGQKAAISINHRHQVATNSSGDQIGLVVYNNSSASAGGTNTGAGSKGALYAINPIVACLSGATNYHICSGGEIDVILNAGASAQSRLGLSIVSADSGSGATYDAALDIAAAAGPWKNVIFIESAVRSGVAPVMTTGCVICTDGSTQTIANVISLPNWTISGKIFDFSAVGVTVDGPTGVIAAKGVTISTISGSTQCLHVNTTGVVSGLAADCQVNLGYNGGASIPFTSTATSGGGSITSQTSNSTYIQIGKVIFLNVVVTITNGGTATGLASISLPSGVPCKFGSSFVPGRESGISGKMISGVCTGGTTLALLNYDNTNATLSTGASYNLTGGYETP